MKRDQGINITSSNENLFESCSDTDKRIIKCKICGSDGFLFGEGSHYCVTCSNDDCLYDVDLQGNVTDEMAIDAWNSEMRDLPDKNAD